jgi:hypothetical protein
MGVEPVSCITVNFCIKILLKLYYIVIKMSSILQTLVLAALYLQPYALLGWRNE